MGSDKAILRRYEDNLNVCGFGVIILGAWDIMKLIMQLLLDSKEVFNLDLDEGDKAVAMLVIILSIAVILLLSYIIFRLHLYVGLNAQRAAKGQPYKKGYYVAAIVLLVLSVASMAAYIDEIQASEHIETTIASIIVDLTTIYILATMVSSTYKIRKLNAATGSEPGEN